MSDPLEERFFGGDYESQMHHDNAVALDRAIRRDRLCQRLALAMHGRTTGDDPVLAHLVDHYPDAVALILKQFEDGDGK